MTTISIKLTNPPKIKLAVWKASAVEPAPKNALRLPTKSDRDMVCAASEPAPVPKSRIGDHNSPSDIVLGALARNADTSLITTGMKNIRIVAKVAAKIMYMMIAPKALLIP